MGVCNSLYRNQEEKVLGKSSFFPGLKVLFLGIGLFAGCVSSGFTKDRLITLEDAIQSYVSGIRWQHYEILDTLVRPRNGQSKPVSREFLNSARITRYEVRRRQLSEDGLTAKVTIKFNYYYPDDNVIRTLNDQQGWWYEEESQRWFLEKLPNFTQASPSL